MRVVGAANDNSKKKLTVVLTTLAPEMGEQYNDPFDTLPVQSTPEVHAAIRHYFEHYPGPTPFTHDSLVYDKNAYKREKMEWSQVQFSFCQDQKIAVRTPENPDPETSGERELMFSSSTS
ncbi:putative protein of unknown function DUF1741 [Diplodia seriata]|uniref:Uncharacterized protein n=1 Tax=Diplodia seriata TaxID=420778 RepID=A0A0G2EZF5_9PEZI|nr:putative protein of unknown function DUF1741 [Diplodia seriata]